MKDIEKTDLPVGWVKADVDTVSSDIISGSGFPKEYQGESAGEYPFAKVGTISKAFRAGHKTMNSADNYISEDIRVKIKAKSFPKGTIVFPKIGEALKNNYRVITSREMIFDNNVMGIVPDTRCIVGDYFYYFLTTKDFGEFAVATAVPSVRRGDVASISIPLPPLPEQHRIVAKIEELFSELDKGIESFNTAREQLKVYRQALLKHAFEGKLTAVWREEHKEKLESADALLKRIQAERAERYRQQVKEWEKGVKEWEKSGKQGSKPGKPSQPKELSPLTAEELVELPQLPKGWGWWKLGWMTCGVEYGTSAKSSEVGVCPVLRMGNIQNSKFDWEDLAFTSDQDEINKYTLTYGDVLFNRTNSPELVGKTAIYKAERAAIFAGYLIRVNQIESIASGQYLNLFLNASIAKQHGNKVKTDGVNQSNINGNKLINYPFPFCSVSEQNEIITLLDEKLSVADNFDETITTALLQAEALRQSILKKAFSGQLVPQDPNDEPAAKLLARIKAERESHSKGDKEKKRTITRKKKTAKV